MKCGNRKLGFHEHDTVAEVRACYGLGQTTPATSPTKKSYTRAGDPAVYGDLPKIHESKTRTAERSPAIAVPERPGAAIPAGYYATPSLTGNNDLDFWKIEKGKGRWDGYTFVKRVVGGHADQAVYRGKGKKRAQTEPVRDKVTQLAAMNAIQIFGIEKSNRLFGTKLKYCRECGIHLTDERSRSLGIGPVCEGK